MLLENNLLAGAIGAPSSGQINNPLFKGTFLESITLVGSGPAGPAAFINVYLPMAIGWLFVIGLVGFLFMVILGGIQWIFSGGDKGAVEAAKGRFTNALIGLVLLLSTFAIIKLIETFFGINILTIDIAGLFIQ